MIIKDEIFDFSKDFHLVSLGLNFGKTSNSAEYTIPFLGSSESIFKNLEMFINKDSVILFKASRSVKMEEIVKLFL